VAILLDTNVLVALSRGEEAKLGRAIGDLVLSRRDQGFVSVASIWEVAIKTRIGKLDLARSLETVPAYCDSIGAGLLNIDHRHVLAELDPEPPTRDPFDRLLLAQCQIEGMRLVTVDRVLAAHPLAWREA
jgi:PIN domain nuclease of toxin-antitoxin system